MRTIASAVFLALLATAFSAEAFRDDLATDPASCAPRYTDVSPAMRFDCHLREQTLGCEGDAAAGAELEAAMQSSPLPYRFQRALQRYRVRIGREKSFCELSAEAQREVVREALAPLRVRSESGKEWLLARLKGPSGAIDSSTMENALQVRRALTIDTRLKRSGLPALPSGWTNLAGFTQSNGRVNHLLIHPSTPNTMWAGADGGGIWKTLDGGATWNKIDDLLGSLSIGTLVMDPTNANILYAGTNPLGSHTYYPFGVLKSVDGGNTWNQLAQTNPGANSDWNYVTRLAIHPTDGSTLLAATYGGAYITSNGGGTWTKVAGISTHATFVAFHPANGNIRAIAYDDGTFRYTTTGDLIGAGAVTSTVLAGGHYMKFAYAPSDTNGNRIYALITDSATGNTKFYKSSTGGSGGGWADLTASISNLPHPSYASSPYAFFNNQSYLSYTGNLWVDPFNPDRVAIAEGWAMFTPNASATPTIARYSLCGGWTDFHAIVAHPGYNGTTNKIVFFMDDGGLYKVTDIDQIDDANTFCVPGVFSRLDTGMTITEVYSVSGRGGNIIIGPQDVSPRVYRTDPSDAAFKWRFTSKPASDPCSGCSWIGDGATTAASRTNPAVLYGSRQYLDLFRSTDGGVTSTSIAKGSTLTEGRGATSPNTNASFIAPFVLDPSNQSRMYAGGQSLWRSSDVDTGNPPTWTSIRGPFVEPVYGLTAPVDTIAVAPSDPNVVWIAYSYYGRVFKTANALASPPTWVEVTTMPVAATGYSKASILFDRTNANIVWVGLAGYNSSTLFKTTDGGTTWNPVPGLPSAPVNALLQHPAQSNWLYAGTSVGLFASADGGATWSTTNEGPANVVVNSLDWYSESGSSADILVGTFGRGVFRATVSAAAATVPGSPTITGAAGGNTQATISFTAPASNGGSAITGYTATCNPGTFAASASSSPIVVTGLTNGTAYTCSVVAINAVGSSTPSATMGVTPSATGDADNDGVPDSVEPGEGLNPALKDNNVFASARLFAMQQYRDFLNREGDSGGITFWTGQINTAAQTRGQCVENFFNSAEFQNNVSPVARLYFAYFLRIPDYAGLQFWINYYKSGHSLDEISNAFAGSPEFASRYGALTNSQFVTLVYQNVLGRNPDSAGLAFWTGQLDSAARTRGQVMLGFSESAEYQSTSFNKIYVTMMYVGMLRRAPDQGGFDFWVGYLGSGNSGLALINGFLTAPEYHNRFLP